MRANKHQTMIGKRIMILAAHPDDEAFLAAGTTYLNSKHDGKTALICATLGEKGSSHLKKPVTKAQLKQIRKRELQKAARLTKISPLHILNLPDGGLSKRGETIYRRSLPLVRKFKPDILLTFGPDGITGHRDHVTVGKAGRKIAKELGVRLCVFTVAPEAARIAPAMFKKNRVNPHYQRIVRYQPAVHRIKISSTRKRQVLKQYVSQIDNRQPFRSWPKRIAKLFQTYECFGEMKP